MGESGLLDGMPACNVAADDKKSNLGCMFALGEVIEEIGEAMLIVEDSLSQWELLSQPGFRAVEEIRCSGGGGRGNESKLSSELSINGFTECLMLA